MNNTSPNVTSHFDLKETWDSFSDRERQRVQATLALVPQDTSSALDIGCGDGRFLHLMRPLVPLTVGIDYHLEPLRRVQTMRVQGSAIHLPFRDESFDLVIATEVLEHFGMDDFNVAVREATRVSHKYVMITVPYRENVEGGLCLCADCGQTFHRYGHMRSFEKCDLETIGDGLKASLITSIVPIQKTRCPRSVSRMLNARGSTYVWDANARCPNCGGLAQARTGNSLGIVAQRIIWRIDKHFPKLEDGWVVAVYQKTSTTR